MFKLLTIFVLLSSCTAAPENQRATYDCEKNPEDCNGGLPEKLAKTEELNFTASLPENPAANIPLTISWSLVNDVEYYQLTLGRDSTCTDILIEFFEKSGTSQLVTITTEGTYYVCMSAKKKDGSIVKATNYGALLVVGSGQVSSKDDKNNLAPLFEVNVSGHVGLSGLIGDGSISAPFTFNINEDTTNGVFKFSMSDPNGDSIDFNGIVPGWVSLDSGNQQFTLSPSTPGTSNFILTVIDGKGKESGPLYFSITVNDINDAPTDINISASSIAENQSINTIVGGFSAIDEDSGDSHTYALVAGPGDTDNGSFNISGGNLRTSAIFDFETKTSYSIRVEATDSGTGNLKFAKTLAISITGANDDPTDISLTSTDIDENNLINDSVGTLSATDPDSGDTATFALVAGTGSTDNASFNISGSSLRASAAFNNEIKSSYAIRLQVTDGGGLTYEKQFTISINDINESPTDISLSSSSVDENNLVNDVIGTLSATDPDVGDSETFALVSGTGSTDNSSFNISGTSLRASAAFNQEAKSSYSIRLRITDSGGMPFEKQFSITINDVNEQPTDISLSSTSIDELNLINDVVGGLSASDPDVGDSAAYALVAGAGSDDNSSFNINGTNLRASAIFDFETKSSYSIRLEVTDGGGLKFEKQFTISINDLVENLAPTNITMNSQNINENSATNTVVGSFSTVDPNIGDSHAYTLVAGTGSDDNASFNINTNQLRSSSTFDHEAKSSYTVRVRSTDNGTGSLYFEKAFTITIDDVNEDPTADAGPDQSLGLNAPGTLDGTGSSDPEGTSVTYLWNQTAGSAVTLSSNTASQPTFTTPNSTDTLIFSLTVSDSVNTSVADTVTITVAAAPSVDDKAGNLGACNSPMCNAPKGSNSSRFNQTHIELVNTSDDLLWVAHGDFQNDNYPDILYQENADLKIRLNTDGAGIGTASTIATFTAESITSILAADFNGDDDLDLLLQRNSGEAKILLGDGDGTFGAQANFSTNTNFQKFALGDIDNDGTVDAVVFYDAGGASTDELISYLGSGSGTFAQNTTIESGASISFVPVGIADFNNDNYGDLLVREGAPTVSLKVYRSLGNGNFAAPITLPTTGYTPDGYQSALWGDFNNDGYPDVITHELDDGNSYMSIRLHLNNTAGNFAAGTLIKNLPVNLFMAYSLADINNDNNLDMIGTLVNFNVSSGSILFGDGAGAFSEYEYSIPSSATDIYYPASILDYNNDGALDLSMIYQNQSTGATVQKLLLGEAKNVAFVSSATNGNIGGLSGADDHCYTDANNNDLPGVWKAILSDGSTDAKDRFAIDAVIQNLDYKPIASSETALWTGLSNSIGYDAARAVVAADVWTGTTAAGLKSGANFCSNWSSTSGSSVAYGQSNQSSSSWIAAGTDSCSASKRIYCIRSESILVPTLTGTAGTNNGEVDLVMSFPGDTAQYDHVSVRSKAGATAPNSDCADGGDTVVTSSITNFAANWVNTHATGGAGASVHSYRACIYNSSSDLLGSIALENITSGNASCAGSSVGGSCWFLGTSGQSCTQTCTNNGGLSYDSATETYAGSGAADETGCSAVLTALLSGSTTAIDGTESVGVGCLVSMGSLPIRVTNTTTNAGDTLANAQRACACQ